MRCRPIAGTFTFVQAYSTSPQWFWNTTGSPSGDYVVRVDVRAVGSTVAVETSATLSYKLRSGPATSVTLTATLASPQIAGTPTNITFAAENVLPALGDYEYRFILIDPLGIRSIVQAYSPNSQWIWNISTSTPGAYRVRVDVRSRTSTQIVEAFAVMDFTLN
jgi:hypothetical protein